MKWRLYDGLRTRLDVDLPVTYPKGVSRVTDRPKRLSSRLGVPAKYSPPPIQIRMETIRKSEYIY